LHRAADHCSRPSVRLSVCPSENTTARLVSQTGRRRSSYPESKNCSLVFRTRATGCLDRVPVGPVSAPALIRTQPGQTACFTAPSASGHAGSRTGLPHCTPQRHGGVDEARDWPRLPESKGNPGIIGRLSPLLLRRSPPSIRSSPSSGVYQDWPDLFPVDDASNLPPRHAATSAGFASG